MKTAREVALRALCRVEEEKAYSNLVVKQLFDGIALSERDRDFAISLFYGTLERKLTLDYTIRQYSHRPLERLQPTVRQILRLGFYQILFSHVDAFAAVNETVLLCKRSGAEKATGFVNALLRCLLRNDRKVEYPSCEQNLLSHLSIVYSCPKWLVKSFLRDYGVNQTEHLLQEQLQRPPVYLRVNSKQVTAKRLMTLLQEEGCSVLTTLVENCLALQGGNPTATKAFEQGLYHIQDISSQLAAQAISAYHPHTVLDLCAAPGGKSFTVAEEIEGEIASCDLTDSRISLIREGMLRLRLTNMTLLCNDASISLPDGMFDLVLCDVPCSGFGVIRRKPEIKYKPKESILSLPKLQKQIVSNAVSAVKPGGYLVYSTCTLRREENEEVVAWLEEQFPSLLPQSPPAILRSWFPVEENRVTFLSRQISCDGFFFAVFRKR